MTAEPTGPRAQTLGGGVQRFWELDVIRFVAVLMMVVYHSFWDVANAHGLWWLATTGFWGVFQQITAGLFIGLAGVAMTLTESHRVCRSRVRTFAPRAALLFGVAMLLSGAALASGLGRIDFGVLHLIAVSQIAALPLLGHPRLACACGALVIAIGIWISRVHLPTLTWIPIGITPHSYPRMDFMPIFPWLGALLVGTTIGSMWYPHGRRRWTPPDIAHWRSVRWAAACGRHTLVIYLVHQPVLYAVLLATGLMPRSSAS